MSVRQGLLALIADALLASEARAQAAECLNLADGTFFAALVLRAGLGAA